MSHYNYLLRHQKSWKDVLPQTKGGRRIRRRSPEERAALYAEIGAKVVAYLKAHGPTPYPTLYRVIPVLQSDLDAAIRLYATLRPGEAVRVGSKGSRIISTNYVELRKDA